MAHGPLGLENLADNIKTVMIDAVTKHLFILLLEMLKNMCSFLYHTSYIHVYKQENHFTAF